MIDIKDKTEILSSNLHFFIKNNNKKCFVKHIEKNRFLNLNL